MPAPPDPSPGAEIARQVRDRGVTNARVLSAIARFDRSRFIPPESRSEALADRAVPIGMDQTISQPFMVGKMTEELDLRPTDRVLEVGTGSGYQAAILSAMAREVVTIERLTTLSLRARSILDGLGITNVRFAIGDGSLGLPEFAPYDRILVTAGAPGIPAALFEQLADGGRLVAPIGDEHTQQLTVVRKKKGKPLIRTFFPCRFVKLIGEEAWPEP